LHAAMPDDAAAITDTPRLLERRHMMSLPLRCDTLILPALMPLMLMMMILRCYALLPP